MDLFFYFLLPLAGAFVAGGLISVLGVGTLLIPWFWISGRTLCLPRVVRRAAKGDGYVVNLSGAGMLDGYWWVKEPVRWQNKLWRRGVLLPGWRDGRCSQRLRSILGERLLSADTGMSVFYQS